MLSRLMLGIWFAGPEVKGSSQFLSHHSKCLSCTGLRCICHFKSNEQRRLVASGSGIVFRPLGDASALLFCRKYCSTFSQAWDRVEFFPVEAIFSISPSPYIVS